MAGDWVVVGVEPEQLGLSRTPQSRFAAVNCSSDLLQAEMSFLTLLCVRLSESRTTWLQHSCTDSSSVMVWKRKAYIRVVGHTGGTHPIRVGGRKAPVGLHVTHHPGYDPADFPTPSTPSQDLALALYREALGLVDDTYSFSACSGF